MSRSRRTRVVAPALALLLVLAACTSNTDDSTTTSGPLEQTTTIPMAVEPMEPEVVVPFLASWESSGHADASAEAFVHWNEDDPQVVPGSCAKCHSESGFHDFLGLDGSEAGVVDTDHEIGSVVSCVTCHNDAALALNTVTMPSGAVLTDLGSEARCMACHQGRESKASVDAAIAELGVEEDTVREELGFRNIHYYAAAATKYGTLAKGGYEYEGKTYDGLFAHVDGFTTCVDCHNSHTLEVKLVECTTCHTDVATVEDLRDIRMPGSLVDFDGDGDLAEGIYYEIEGVRMALLTAIQSYANEVSETSLAYDSHSYPYFFIDTNDDGTAAADEAVFPNAFNAWTPRLLKAAYNYQVSLKDPGNYAHGGKYTIQLMYDSIESLNEVIASPVALDKFSRIDHGHFAGSEEAFRHWDEEGAVAASCAKCHSASGLPLFLAEGVSITQPISNGFLCTTCHASLEDFSLRNDPEAGVKFPSGAVVDSGSQAMNLCINCHQGRSSSSTVDGRIGDTPGDTVSESLGFINIHYFAAGATLFGSEVSGGYEYADKEYAGRFEHVGGLDTCTSCHNTHTLEVEFESCGGCHAVVDGPDDLRSIRIADTDYDGDGDTTEGIAGEIETMSEALYVTIQAYALATDGVEPIVYESHTYPYFFIDANADGAATPDEASFGNRYASFTPSLLRATYIYQYAQKDPGGFAHNSKYIMQMLYDASESLGGDVSGMTRP